MIREEKWQSCGTWRSSVLGCDSRGRDNAKVGQQWSACVGVRKFTADGACFAADSGFVVMDCWCSVLE
jgi:hypothetical protein